MADSPRGWRDRAPVPLDHRAAVLHAALALAAELPWLRESDGAATNRSRYHRAERGRSGPGGLQLIGCILAHRTGSAMEQAVAGRGNAPAA
jgi:hypothetical protein